LIARGYFPRVSQIVLALCLALGESGCEGSASMQPAAHALPGGEVVELPPASDRYSTAARAPAILGGPTAEALANDVSKKLAARGDHATPDGALSATGSALMAAALSKQAITSAASEDAARRFGFAGVLLSMATFTPSGESADAWQHAIEQIPRNMPITRFGVTVSQSGRLACVVFGSVELELADFPRRVEPGAKLKLRGKVAERFKFAHVYLTGSDGNVAETRLPDRALDTTLAFPTPGVYQVEVMGDGPSGPVVLANVPVYAGVPEPHETEAAHVAASPEEAESRMLELLNEARKTAHLGPLAPDAELRAIALGHSEDMSKHDFFGHVSPTTGSIEDRIRRSGVAVSLAGENVAEVDTPESAHEILMRSPGHRAIMLGPKFTHVGIGITRSEAHPALMLATLVFGRRPTHLAADESSSSVLAAVQALRKAKHVPALQVDPLLGNAAQAGVQAFANTKPANEQNALRVAGTTLSQLLARAHQGRPAGCSTMVEILELAQLEQYAWFVDPELKRFGLAVAPYQDMHSRVLAVMALGEGGSCK
jgi:uncharacterized protein YkwD